MCGRFARKSTQEVLAEWLGLELEEMPWFAPTYNAAPQSIQPVIRLNRDSGRREAALLRWGLVPADAFYEWKRQNANTKQPFAIALKSGEPYAFAGLWESWRPKDGEPLETFTILTTDPNEVMEPIHNRMPVILEPRDYDRWLDPGDPARPPMDLLCPYPAELMKAWPVSDRVGNVRNNEPSLLDPAVAGQLQNRLPLD
jgi:putative SOS response-associated peptidase YedK